MDGILFIEELYHALLYFPLFLLGKGQISAFFSNLELQASVIPEACQFVTSQV